MYKTLKILLNPTKHSLRFSTNALNNNDISPIFTNRNPRNLERLRIGYKPDGYHVEQPGHSFWHKLELDITSRYVTATVKHFENGEVLRASTQEWALKKQLYRYVDSAAYINLGRVLAQRCLESGLTEMSCFLTPNKTDGKVDLFLKAVQEGGVSLQEPEQYKKPRAWDKERPEKPWDVTN